ncbi:hypothetical protein AMATHDRAFT_60780 [Amanita thiersii Skay4041]|uniref:Major facilitator superfamily (MFS) profile domain-containing protein n=1 Tax=Amanita thiersii Skay4041 TaxID=703135 RepID=A0A2A9NQV2_9AGAR|nr:hypothetical protein AMATHDRAFT_60780 [Amanita thiersii Skay4041]
MSDISQINPRTRLKTPSRVFGIHQLSMDDSDLVAQPEPSVLSRVLGRLSFSSKNRQSMSARLRSTDSRRTTTTERPPIPSMLRPPEEIYVTPLPTLSMVVLSITMLGEFLSANVSTPFLLFMVKGFGQVHDDAEIAFWTGILVSTFFLTQFVTSLLWATIAEKHGRRVVLVVSLLGSALTCFIFGTATSLQQAICVRLMQGIFAGAVGVARGSVTFITDPSNEGRAYAILGFCWGFGGVAGAIIGGTFERPAVKWPDVFGDIKLFITYPYLLPCAIAALITLIGSILACFLGPDGGPREGAIRLLPEKEFTAHPTIPEEESPISNPLLEDLSPSKGLVQSFRTIPERLSDYLRGRARPENQVADANLDSLNQPAVPMASSNALSEARASSRVSRADGSAYGYSGNYRNRLASNTAATQSTKRGSMGSSMRRRRGYSHDANGEPGETHDLNFAQRLLMANENAVTNIADLWVAAAMNVDNENPFESDIEDSVDEDIESVAEDEPVNTNNPALADAAQDRRGRRTSRSQWNPQTGPPTQIPSRSHRPSHTGSSYRPQMHYGSPQLTASPRLIPGRQSSVAFSVDSTQPPRRPTTPVPSIFSHPGVKTPRAVLDAQELLLRSEEVTPPDALDPIFESRHSSEGDSGSDVEAFVQKQPSLASQLPILVIVQYGMLALHSTTHDQVFMSYLVSNYRAGGLNLNAGHFAQLIALMCLAQIAYQFYLYPNLGPPRGKFSHLAMFRLGSCLFIPAYLAVIPLRPFASASEDGNFLVMAGLVITTAVRYCGTTFGYTAISILLNYMTPPSAVGYANGIAQSIVSLARCLGPVIGGYLWSISVSDDPSGYSLGFIVCAVVCALCVAQSYMIR